MAAGALLVARAGAHSVRRPRQLAREPAACPSRARGHPGRPAPLAARERPARRAPALHEPGDRRPAAPRRRRSGASPSRRAPGAAARGRRTACRPSVPGAAAGAGAGRAAPAATAAGAARVPAPKKRAASVACPRTGPAQRRREDAAAAGGRPRRPPGAARACAAARPSAGRRSPRVRPVAGSHGFTSQYSNQVTERGRRERLRIVTSWSSSGSSPNGAYTCSPTASRPAAVRRREVARAEDALGARARAAGRGRAC